jgi:hypothetical protein
MYTTVDKAIVATVMAVIQLINVFGFHFGMDQATVTVLVSVITPILVHLIPNLPKDAA